MTSVDLGYSEPIESWRLESRFFPSKIGGKPAWLHLEGVPAGEDLSCTKCGEPMIFLCQIYAPYEEDDNNFHRTLFIFICRRPDCYERNKSAGIKVFRSSLKRENKFYPYDPPREEQDASFSLSNWLNLCEVCGCPGEKKCSKCNSVSYCGRQHQIVDWKERHKSCCGSSDVISNTTYSKILFPESEIIIEPEELDQKEVDEEQEKEKYLELVKQGKSGTLTDETEEELDQHSAKDPDKTFTKFRKIVDQNPDQILRYARGGDPLLISNEVLPDNIPDCEYCGSKRQFEFQIMPQMLSLLKEQELDWGVLLFYSCMKSCQNEVTYKKEYVLKQDVSLIDLKC